MVMRGKRSRSKGTCGNCGASRVMVFPVKIGGFVYYACRKCKIEGFGEGMLKA